MLKKNLIFMIVLSLVFALPAVMAATTLNVPVSGTNYTTITFNCSTAVANALNATIFYNASGGTAGTVLGTIVNDTASDTDFTQLISIEALSDTLTYNFSCYVDSGVAQESSSGVTSVGVDNTAPTYTFSLLKSKLNTGRTQEITWTSADATSGVETVNASIVTPNNDRCSNQEWSATSGTNQQFLNTNCEGTYTATLSITDNAGNTASTSPTFKTVHAGPVRDSEGVLGLGDGGSGKGNLKTILIIIIIAVIVYLVVKKK
jgi:hypothetical protein